MSDGNGPAPSLEKIYEVIDHHRKHDWSSAIEHGACQFHVCKDVFSPFIAPSGLLGFSFSSLPLLKGKRILDVGCGSGVHACLMAQNGASVVGADISPKAVECARGNAARNFSGPERPRFLESDLLDAISDENAYDIVYADLPFTNGTPHDLLEHAFFDLDYKSIRRLIQSAPAHRATRSADLYVAITTDLAKIVQQEAAASRFACSTFLTIDLQWITLALLKLSPVR